MLNSFKGFNYWAIMWYPDDQIRNKLDLCMLLEANKNIVCKNQFKILTANNV